MIFNNPFTQEVIERACPDILDDFPSHVLGCAALLFSPANTDAQLLFAAWKECCETHNYWNEEASLSDPSRLLLWSMHEIGHRGIKAVFGTISDAHEFFIDFMNLSKTPKEVIQESILVTADEHWFAGIDLSPIDLYNLLESLELFFFLTRHYEVGSRGLLSTNDLTLIRTLAKHNSEVFVSNLEMAQISVQTFDSFLSIPASTELRKWLTPLK